LDTVSLHIPDTCSKCGFHNFNVQGSVYNRGRNQTRIEVRCMRCGKVQTLVNEKPADSA